MQIKFQKSILSYNYLVMFDLASKITGVCVWDINAKKPLDLGILCVQGQDELPVIGLYNELQKFFDSLWIKGIQKQEVIVSFEAVPSQIRSGKSSTIQTFIALSKAHAALELFLYMNDIDYYDGVGLYPITTHAYLKKIKQMDQKEKVTKEHIKSFVIEEYHLNSEITFDESDAVFLAKTFIDVKWNRDIEEKIREIKRHKKALKAQHAINSCELEIERLNNIKN